ncbi:chloroplast sensor kinase, chloroplastic isoform X2 [Mercurialis annua]|uniref:chloroplast sensor kinase, chloroplastic isoform X2 n=1 Tax=Mercurialis annua TaxID=3986 RepID=UPI00216094D5|nr:chloroplast sensor kinase, chloroplastic isoform X2 [Mercurialis annua]
MLLSATRLHITALSPANLHFSSAAVTTTTTSSTSLKPLLLTTTNASSSSNSSSSPLTSTATTHTQQNQTLIHQVSRSLPDEEPEQQEMVSSASAIASAIRKTSNSPIEFVQEIEKSDNAKLVLPSLDFRRLCVQQLDLFRRIVHPDAILSVYVRPAGSYVMDRLELRRVTSFPGMNASDVVMLVGNFNVPAGLRAAEAALSSQQVEFVPEHKAVVFPMVKHPFVVGFLVAELPILKTETSHENVQTKVDEHSLIRFQSPEENYALPSSLLSSTDNNFLSRGIQTLDDHPSRMYNFTSEQRLNAINISCSVAMAYVMDQKAMLLQQSSWQNNVRMSNLVEQIRGPLSSIQTLSKMLSTHIKKTEISYDIVEDILVQGDRLRDTLQELQDAVRLTKANIMRYNEEALQKMQNSTYHHESQLSDSIPRYTDNANNTQNSGKPFSLNAPSGDSEMPMPPMALASLQQDGIRPCNVTEVLLELVGAVQPLARMQQRDVVLCGLSQTLQVAVEEPSLRQALSNLIEDSDAFAQTIWSSASFRQHA